MPSDVALSIGVALLLLALTLVLRSRTTQTRVDDTFKQAYLAKRKELDRIERALREMEGDDGRD